MEEWFERQSYDKAYNTLRGHTDFGGEISGYEPHEYAPDGDSYQRRHYKKAFDSSAHPRVGGTACTADAACVICNDLLRW